MSKEMKLIPELRFPEFENKEWHVSPIDDYCDVFRGSTFSKSDITDDGSEPCIHYGELFTKYNEVISKVYSRTDKQDGFKSEAGDVLMPSSDVTPDGLARASAITFGNVILGGDMNILRPYKGTNSIFLSYLLNHSKREIIKLVSGTTVKHIYPSQIITCELPVIVNEAEQQKIASCLSSLDELIAAHKDKLDALKDHKKGLLQNLFPQEGENVPKVRFPEFEDDGEWVEKTFEELFTIGSGKDYKHLSEGEIPVYGSGGYMLSVDDFLHDGESVCIGRKGTIDNPIFLTGKFWTVDTLFYTYQFVDCLPKFIYYIFLGINWQNHNEAGGVPSLSKKNLYQITTAVPTTIEEQKKIASCLSAVDELITAQQEKIEQLQQHKKGLMQGLFPSVQTGHALSQPHDPSQ